MKQVTETPTSVAWLAGKHEYPADSLTLIVKATFKVSPNGIAELSGDIRHVCGDLHLNNDKRQMQEYESDFAVYKPMADVFVTGSCFVPGEKPESQCAVKISLGSVSKAAMVNGPRFQMPGLVAGTSASAPMEFTSTKITVPSAEPNYLPEFETPATADQPKPVPSIDKVEEGFGPIHKTNKLRTQYLGTYDDKWKKERWPWFPEDFDYQYFNGAPEDLQTDYLKGDEAFTVQNMHPEFNEYNCQLPGLVARCFLNESESAEDPAATNLKEVSMSLDTFWLDMDSETLVLVWRGVTDTQSQKYLEYKHVYTALDPVEAPLSTEEHTDKFLELAFPAPLVVDDFGEEEEETQEEVAQAEESPASEEADSVDAALDKALEDSRAQLEKSGMDKETLDKIMSSDDPMAVVDQMYADMGMTPADADAARQASKEAASKSLAESGLSPEDIKLLLGG